MNQIWHIIIIFALLLSTQDAKCSTNGESYLNYIITKNIAVNDKKVFAHYFTPFPLSFDNKKYNDDYYNNNYINPDGEKFKWQKVGGYLRERPIPPLAYYKVDWMQENYKEEVRRARAIGIDGFAIDILGFGDGNVQWERLLKLQQAAFEVDTNFKIMAMPDMDVFADNQIALIDAIKAFSNFPNAFLYPSHKLVVSPYNAHRLSAKEWSAILQKLKSDGIEVSFLPTFQGWKKYYQKFMDISIGFSDWGCRTVNCNTMDWQHPGGHFKQLGKIWMAPVSPQDYRPKENIFREASNSENYRMMWKNAIEGDSQFVHVISWNDYSEHTEVSPSTGIGWSFAVLTKFYSEWFKTQIEPQFSKEFLLYIHRNAKMKEDGNRHGLRLVRESGSRVQNNIEIVAFLKANALVKVTFGEKSYEKYLEKGVSFTKFPIHVGNPVISVYRNDGCLMRGTSSIAVSSGIEDGDALYRGGFIPTESC